MAISQTRWGAVLLVLGIVLVLMPSKVAAFGAGNIPSISQVEGHNWRHGDIEDMLQTLMFLKGKKWSSRNISRVYFGNWLRDYSQAVDLGSLKGVNAETVRILVWVLSFLSFGYATAEYEVTADRLGVYRPEEHIDNPLGYGDGKDAREFDPRLRGPVDPREVEIDPRTGMKNYIANESGGWATSVGYLRFSFARSIHFGRVYTSGVRSGKEEDLCEALRCLGQALHCMEDFSAHSNYCELVLRELGHHDVFTHCGTSSEINLNGRRVYPLVTGTFGAVDFLHSVIGEATDNLTQSEVDEMNEALISAQNLTKPGPGDGNRSFLGSSSSGDGLISLLDKLPGVGSGFASEARSLQAESAAQEQRNQTTLTRDNQVPGMSPDFDAVATAKKIYPILAFRDKIVRAISDTISKIPGMEKLLERIGETLTAFVLGLLAPFIRPIINGVSKVLKDGSSGVIATSANSQLEPWKDPMCSNPTHSMLSKDHFTNVLNSCAGRVASTILQYVVPRVLYAWENPGVPVDEVVNDVIRAFHHPAARNESIEIQKQMFETVRSWASQSQNVIRLLSSENVRLGKNHVLANGQTASKSLDGHSHGPTGFPAAAMRELGGHGRVAGSLWSQVKTRDMSAMSSGSSGASAPPEPDYSTRPPADSHLAYNQPAPPAAYGYGGQGGQHQQYGQAQGYTQQHQPPNPQGYGGTPQYVAPSPYPQQPQYGQQPPYPPQPTYPQQPGAYGHQPSPYPPQPTYPQHSPYPPQQPPYGQQPPYQPHQQPHGHQGGWGQYPGQQRY